MHPAQRALDEIADGGPLRVRWSRDHVLIAVGGGRPRRFALYPTGPLTQTGLGIIRSALGVSSEPPLVLYERASEEVRADLRRQGVSYAGADGRCFVFAEDLLIDRDRPRGVTIGRVAPTGWQGLRASRVPRMLLLSMDSAFSIGEIAEATELSVASASRAVQALEHDGHVEVVETSDSRRKMVRLRAARPLLQDLHAMWQHRRLSREPWDVGTSNVDETLALLAGVDDIDVAVGGLAGAALLERAVEPANVLVWIRRGDLPALRNELMPIRTSPTRAMLRVAVAPDPAILAWARPVDGRALVADPVQLWLDCLAEGERAIEAAGAIERRMGW